MKKLYTIMLMLAFATGIVANAALSDVQTLWVKEVKNSADNSKQTTQGGNMALDAEGNLLVVGQAGSTTVDEVISFGDEDVAIGVNYAGNGANQGLLAMKLSTDGSVLWTLSQTSGEVANNAAKIASTADGGAVIMCSARHSEGFLTDAIAFVDNTGNETVIDYSVGNERSYCGLVIKVNGEGAVQWVKTITANTEASAEQYPKWTANSRHIGEGLKINGLAVDNAGNIYIGGNMVATVTIDDVAIEPHNIATWNGKTSDAGNLFVIKLDAEGNYVKHLLTTGVSTTEAVQQLKTIGNDIYMFALAKGVAAGEFALGNETFATTNNYQSPLVAKLDANLDVTWAKFYESTVSGSAWQMPTLEVYGDKLYLAGSAKFGITIGDNSYANSASNHAREPWLLQLDANSGNALACIVAPRNQHGFYGVYEGVDGNLYVAERGLTPANANWTNKGEITCIDPATLTEGESVEYCNWTSDGQSLLVSGTTAYLMFRHGNQSKDVTFVGSNEVFNSAAFRWTQLALQMPEEAGVVSAINLENDPSQTLVIEKGGDTYQLNASVVPATAANTALIYTSSDEGVVKVDQNGLLTADKHGEWYAAPARARRAPAAETAVITVTSASNPNVKTSFTVRVDNPTAVTDLDQDETDVVVSGNTITAATQAVDVFNPLGQCVARVGAGESVSLPAGIYIVQGKKFILR